jgi:hypothetical protein
MLGLAVLIPPLGRTYHGIPGIPLIPPPPQLIIVASTQFTLDGLPIELLESVVALLKFRDISSLRLISRNIAARSCDEVFKEYFTTKAVKWTSSEQMQEFVHLTQPC